MRRTSFAPTRRRRSPMSIVAPLLALLLVAFLLYLGFASNEQPLRTIEQDVTNDVQAR